MKRCVIFFISAFIVIVGCKKNDKKEYYVRTIEVVCDYTFNDTTKWAITCRVWGLLKYYHPNVTSGKLDWDKVLLDRLDNINKAQTPELFNDELMGLIRDAGKYKGTVDKKWNDSMNMNVNLCWLDNSFIHDTIRNELRKIASLEVRQPSYYVDYQHIPGKIDKALAFENEKDYPLSFVDNYKYRMLALFRYWNIIYYFFPFKHLMDTSWDITLEEFIPLFLNADVLIQYKEAVLKIAAKINDGHAYTSITPNSVDFHSNISVMIDSLTVVRTPPEQSLLKRGDVILSINGQDIIHYRDSMAYIVPSSNKLCTDASINSLIDDLIMEGCELDVIRDGMNLAITERKKQRLPQKETRSFNMITPEIGYVKMDLIKTTADVDRLFDTIENVPAIIFDLRNYPSNAVVWLFCHLTDNAQFYGGTMYNQDLSRCGSYYIEELILPCMNNEKSNCDKKYRGKMVVLIYVKTFSFPEHLATLFRDSGATLIGTPTAGAQGNIADFIMPGKITAIFSSVGWFFPNVGEIQRKGVIPDIEVYPTMESIMQGKDEILEAAIRFINF